MTAIYRPRSYTDTELKISDWGYRRWANELVRCGSRKFYPWVWVPRRPTLEHSLVRLLWAIHMAESLLQDRPTRHDVQSALTLLGAFTDADNVNFAYVDGYWKDLNRFGFVHQYRRSFGKGSNKHWTVVYDLTWKGMDLLETARQNANAKEQVVEFVDPGMEKLTVPWSKQHKGWLAIKNIWNT